MNSQQKMISLLTICRKAGKLLTGFDAVKEQVMSKKVSAVLVTSDASPKTVKEIGFFCGKAEIPVISIEAETSDMHYAIGRKTAVMGVTDEGFSKKFSEMSSEYK